MCPKDPWLLPPAVAQAVGWLDSNKGQSTQIHEVWEQLIQRITVSCGISTSYVLGHLTT